jgi:hypothetical protein
MDPVVDQTHRAPRYPGTRSTAKVALGILAGALVLITGQFALGSDPGDTAPILAADPTTTSTSATPSTVPATSNSTAPTTTSPTVPEPVIPVAVPYIVPPTEVAAEAKQLAVDIAQLLTTYEPADDHLERLAGLTSGSGLGPLAEASEPLIRVGWWSRGEVIYPQLGGLTRDRASVMVVTRQTVGLGAEFEWTAVRTLDIRLVKGEAGWAFEYLSSAGGALEDLGDMSVAHRVVTDPRIEMPDSARLDILSGLVSPALLDLMAELAERTPYGVVVLATGHPHNVFETDRQSHHTVGRAVDIYRIGDRQVIDDREPGSATYAFVEWLYAHPAVVQVGAPWDLDGSVSSRSFTNEVHQDHIHVAVRG